MPSPPASERALAWIVDRPRRSAAAIVLLTAFALIGLTHEFEPWRRVEVKVSDAQRELWDTDWTFELDIGQALLIVTGEELFRPAVGAWLEALEADLEGHAAVERVITLADVPSFEGGGLRPLLPAASAGEDRWRAAARRAPGHPLAADQLVSRDGRAWLVPILVDRSVNAADLDVARDLRALLDAHPPPGGVQAELTGRGPLWLDHRVAFEQDHHRLRFAAFSLVAVLALLLFRNLPAAAITGGAPALGLVWTFGVLGWMGERPEGMTRVVTPILLMMVGFTDSVHLMLAFRRARMDGSAPRKAARETLTTLGGACFLTSITTAVGFASLTTARSEMLQDFGIACSIGALMTFAAVVLVLPAACASPAGRWVGGRARRRWGSVGLGRAIGALLQHARPVAVLGVLGTAALATVALGLRPDDRLSGDLPAGSRAGAGLREVQRAFGGVLPLQVRVRWPNGLPSDWLDELAAVEELLAREPEVTAISSARRLLSLLPPGMPTAELPRTLVHAWLREDLGEALVHFRLPDLGTARLGPVSDRLERRLEEFDASRELELDLVGQSLVDRDWVERVTGDLVRSLALAAGVLWVILTLALRSLRHGLVTVVPNLFPLVATAAALRLSGASLSFESVTALVIALGIAVDDTVHLALRYRRERRAGAGVHAALETAIRRVGAAMVLSTVVMVSGFAVVLTSQLPATADFGALACGTIAAALVGDLVFLPALLAVVDRD